jgi:hypothetical protein
MAPLAIAALVLATFLAGLYLGHRMATRRYRAEREQLERHYRDVIDHADDYIEANAAHWGVHVIRNESGEIVRLAMRCGTPALMVEQRLEERRRHKALH